MVSNINLHPYNGGEAPRKKRRSRWESQSDAVADGRGIGKPAVDSGGSLILPGGLQVQLPATLLGEQAAPADATPEVRAKFKVGQRKPLGG